MNCLRLFVILTCVPAAACGGHVSVGADPVGGTAASDASAEQGGSPVVDASSDPYEAATPGCSCPPGQVFRNHSCLSTLEIGCGAPCGSDTPCGQYETCETCGGSSTCGTHDCEPTCIPTQMHPGPIGADSLRLVPTTGSAGQATEVTVYGFSWYIGALGYNVRVEDQVILEYGGGSDCAFRFKLPPHAPGRVAVFVSQYGSLDSWVLAGFFTHSAGDIDDCVQPGFACSQAQDCCTTQDAPVSCSGGRCRSM